MYKFVIPGSDTGANAKFLEFKTGFAAHFSTLGYEAPALDEVLAAQAEFNTALTAQQTARAAAENATLNKDTTRRSSTETIRTWAQRVKTNPLATPAMLTSMGIVPASTPSGPVTVPSELSATPSASGTCTLKWKANGNIARTNYVLEANVNGAGWTWLGSTTKKSFVDGGAIPGVPKIYRVRAQRAAQTSAPSAEAAIYSGEEGITLEVAA